MALIKCPECSKEISNKAISCPHCGFPINDNFNYCDKKTYDVILISINGHDNLLRTIRYLKEIRGLGLANAKKLTENLPQTIFENISWESANKVKSSLSGFGCLTEIKHSSISVETNNDDVISNYYDGKDEVRCPRCSSTAVTIGQRGFSLFSGFLGSNKTVNRCGKCGYSWQPK